MTRPSDPLFDQRIADWLDADPDHAPGTVLEGVLAAVRPVSQRRPIHLSLRVRSRTAMRGAAFAAVALIVALTGTLLALRPDRAIVVGPSASPTATHDAPSAASPTPSPSAPVISFVKGSWMPAGDMTIEHVFHTATLLVDGTVLLTGAAQVGSSAVLYDPATRSFSATGAMGMGREDHTATLLADGRVLVAGGYMQLGDAGTRTSSAELYDPRTGTWAATGSMLTARSSHTATLLPDGRVLVTGGFGDQTAASPTASAELYDPATGTWSRAADIPQGRVFHTATLLRDGRVLVVGGWYGGVSAELYDPATDTWADTGYMHDAPFGHASTLLPDGRVLVAGGRQTIDLTKWAASAELYDPATGSWTPTGSMALHRAYDTATLLDDGTVLVAGGGNLDDGTEQRFAERFDPASGTWSRTADMTTFRVNHTATLLSDGTVLVTGGRSQVRGPGTSYRSTEIYDPFATIGRTP